MKKGECIDKYHEYNKGYENLAVAIIFTTYIDYVTGYWNYEQLSRWAYSGALEKLCPIEPKVFLEYCKKAKEQGLCQYQKTYIL